MKKPKDVDPNTMPGQIRISFDPASGNVCAMDTDQPAPQIVKAFGGALVACGSQRMKKQGGKKDGKTHALLAVLVQAGHLLINAAVVYEAKTDFIELVQNVGKLPGKN